MKNLIEALTIFSKYRNETCPTVCEHDVMYVVDITESEVSETDKARLEELSFSYGSEGWYSFRFGSA